MNENYTDITVILDRSGSMHSIASDVEGGLNQFFTSQKMIPGRCVVSLYQFDNIYEPVFENIDLLTVPSVHLIPRNSTALLDAIGRTVSSIGAKFKNLPENERPGKVIFLIITDGLENASKEYTKLQIKEMIKLQQETYKWEFVFLGANQDAIAEAQALEIKTCGAMTFSPSNAGVNAMAASMSSNIGAYRSGAALSTAFSAEDRKKQADLLSK